MAENQGSSAAEKLTFLLIGGGIGATLALLFAPSNLIRKGDPVRASPIEREVNTSTADTLRRAVSAESNVSTASTGDSNTREPGPRHKKMPPSMSAGSKVKGNRPNDALS